MDNKLKIEYAKSYFVLAQILIILAGFLFASSGIAYNSTFENMDKAVSLSLSNSSTMNQTLVKGLIQVYGDLSQAKYSLYKFLFVLASITSFFSFIAWAYGSRRIHLIK